MNLKDSVQSVPVHTTVQLKFGSVIGLCNREMESGPITNHYLNFIHSKQLATECKQTACKSSLSDIFGKTENFLDQFAVHLSLFYLSFNFYSHSSKKTN